MGSLPRSYNKAHILLYLCFFLFLSYSSRPILLKGNNLKTTLPAILSFSTGPNVLLSLLAPGNRLSPSTYMQFSGTTILLNSPVAKVSPPVVYGS